MQDVQLSLGISDLLLESLEFSLRFSLIKVVLTLGEELLLGHVEELLVRQAELPLHLSHLPA
jgi:hypothetical protein